MSGQIFISYRRDDASISARRLYDCLLEHFPQNKIFRDVDRVAHGVDFVKTIEKTVGSCDVLIAVIGKGWLSSCDQEGQRRLDNLEDFVRIEIATALKCDIRVIPVLVDSASMPRSRDLPDDLKALVRRNALQLSQDRFRTDSERLIDAVERALEKTTAERLEREEKERLKAKRLARQPRDTGQMQYGGDRAPGKPGRPGYPSRPGGPRMPGGRKRPGGRMSKGGTSGFRRYPTFDYLANILASGNFPKEAEHRAVNVPGEPEHSPVDCTVFAPDRVGRKQGGLLQVFLHAPEARRQAETTARKFDPEAKERGHRSLVLDAPIGTTFAFDVEIEGFVFPERTDTLLWTGQPQAATFRFDVPKGSKLRQHAGTVRISQDGAPVGKITFQIEVVLDARDARERPVGKEARHYHACFCSYSSLDRAEMLKRAQGLRAAGLETFIDVLKLRPGDIWNPKIFEAIDKSDLFVVIWSKNASDSKWVKKESRYALRRYKQDGSPDFVPIPVEGPPIASVPRGLRAYHFNDELLGQIRAAELEMRARRKKKSENRKP